ncbi:uncharacterized protein [Montipora foliosa]|uniref:uncharacterized protein n=1 Tax=Montipora foliosa TaxID=591990 RepID=UPI0035F10867
MIETRDLKLDDEGIVECNIKEIGVLCWLVREIAAQRSGDLRAQFRADVQNHRPHELIFIDKTGFDRCLSRKYGYSPKGQRAEVRRIRTNNRRITVISAIGYDGYLAVRVLKPGQKFNRIVFAKFLRNEIVPLLNPHNRRNAHSVILSDNHAVHHVSEVEELIYGAGALLRFLPPYSPDFNPIEEEIADTSDETQWKKVERTEEVTASAKCE